MTTNNSDRSSSRHTLRNSRHPGSRQTGNQQELHACKFLQRQGMVLLRRNYLCKLGEIDLIMTEASQFLVFIEVRYRSQHTYGGPIASVNYYKQRKIRLTATHFLATHPQLAHFACRFDVVGVSCSACHDNLKFEWIRNAFM